MMAPAGNATESVINELASLMKDWQFGSVVRSWLMEFTADVLADDEDVSRIKGLCRQRRGALDGAND